MVKVLKFLAFRRTYNPIKYTWIILVYLTNNCIYALIALCSRKFTNVYLAAFPSNLKAFIGNTRHYTWESRLFRALVRKLHKLVRRVIHT